MIKHAFDAYPKVRTGKYTIMATDQEEEEIIDYGIVEDTNIAQEDPNIPFGEEKQLTAPEPVSVSVNVSKADEEEGF